LVICLFIEVFSYTFYNMNVVSGISRDHSEDKFERSMCSFFIDISAFPCMLMLRFPSSWEEFIFMVATLQGPFGPIVLNTPTFTIGQAPDNQLVLNDPNISSHHALIRVEGQHTSIMDLESMSGTYVNEQRLEQNSPRFLSTNDSVRIGNTTFRYEEQITPPSPPPFPAVPNRESNPGMPLDAQAKPFGHTDYGQQQGNQPPPFSGYPLPPPYNPNPYDQAWVATEVPGGNPSNQLSGQQPRQGLQGQPYAPPPEQKKTKNQLKILLIAVAALIVLAVVGGGIFAVTRPQPFISANSQYQVDMTPAGSTSTEFRVSGHKFSSNSSITFLLDGSVVPGNAAAQSDSDGNLTTATLTVTKDWPLGGHTLKARDANGYTTKDGVALKIVAQGQAHTPGPNGAPPDDQSFTVNATYLIQQAHQIEMNVSGHPDPDGGSVCTSTFGTDGVQSTAHGKDDIGAYTDTYTMTCSGTYKGGKLSLTETLSNETYTYTNGVVCTQPAPFVYRHFEGTFSNATNISGSYKSDSATYNCTQGASYVYNALQGTWTGLVK
jgi:hypothetical protein